jgi:hypothetical protein
MVYRLIVQTSLAVVPVGLACSPGRDPASSATLADTTQLTSTALALRPEAPLHADDDENMVCFHLLTGDTLRDDWAIATRGNQSSYPRAELTLADGRVIALPSKSMLGADRYCLSATPLGPLPAPVQEARIWSSAPITVAGIEWLSTHK